MTSIIRTDVEVEIDVENVLDQVDTDDLERELQCRDDISIAMWEEEHYKILENLYYALRDKGIDEAIKVVNPLLDEKLGRRV